MRFDWGIKKRAGPSLATREFSEISGIIKRADAQGRVGLENKLYTLAMNGNLGAIIFSLKHRAGWRDDYHEVNVNGQVDLNVQQANEREEQLQILRMLTADQLAEVRMHEQRIDEITKDAREKVQRKRIGPRAIETTAEQIE